MINVLALTGFQKAGGLIISLTILIWLIFIGFQLFKSEREPGNEITHAPNRKPYYEDEALETSRLERYLGFALFLIAICAVGLPVYWLNETNRMKNAEAALNTDAVNRGAKLYTSFCQSCHAAEGVGGVAPTTVSSNPLDKKAPPRAVSWVAPPLNTELLRFSPDEVNHIITYGRPNTPMPAWGVEGGGAMNVQQVTDLVAYIDSIQLSPKEAKASTFKVNAQGKYDSTGYNYPYSTPPGNNGEELFSQMCARCHTKGWSYAVADGKGGWKSGQDPAHAGIFWFVPAAPGSGAFGPSLRDGSTINQFPNIQDQIDFVTEGSEPDKPYGARGVGSISGGGMPGFGKMLTQIQIKAIVEYERSLGNPAGTADTTNTTKKAGK